MLACFMGTPTAQSEYQRNWARHKAALERDIAAGYANQFAGGPKDLKRREACEYDLERFFRTYFPMAFPLPFSRNHKRDIARIEEAELHGGLFANSDSRGYGKTTRMARAMLRAILYKHRLFGVVIGATQRLATKITNQQKSELWTNRLLLEDFPEACYPFIRLENKASLCRGQIWEGTPTGIEWGADQLVFANVPPSNIGGSIIVTRAITGAIKGLNHMLPSGEIIRPDFVLLDDIQTRESAKSLIATEDRMQTVDGDVLGLAGHNKAITAVMAITPIYDGDLACIYLDRNKKPEWNGETGQMVEKFPEREDLWDQYRQILDDARKNDGDRKAAKKFVQDNFDEMHRGSVMAWPENYPKGYLSALHYAMDLMFRSPQAFWAEFQCKPKRLNDATGVMLSADEICRKVNGLQQGEVPDRATKLTAFIDVGDSLLWYAVVAWDDDFSGWIIDYGGWPKQNRGFYTKGDANPTLQYVMAIHNPALAGQPTEPVVASALDLLTAELLDRRFRKQDGSEISISRLLEDVGYLQEIVFGSIRRLRQPPETTPIVMPCKGLGLKASQKAISEHTRKPGDLLGHFWRAVKPEPGKLRVVNPDTNYWKGFIHARLFTPLEGRGCLSLYGTKRTDHTLLADHLTSESPKEMTYHGPAGNVTKIQWELKPSRENEGLDCLVGCAVGASMLGCTLAGSESGQKRTGRRRVVSLAKAMGA
jgi:hypothetical protein